jgi:hypothetical protein
MSINSLTNAALARRTDELPLAAFPKVSAELLKPRRLRRRRRPRKAQAGSTLRSTF